MTMEKYFSPHSDTGTSARVSPRVTAACAPWPPAWLSDSKPNSQHDLSIVEPVSVTPKARETRKNRGDQDGRLDAISLDVRPPAWERELASWPFAWWSRWRRRSGELQAAWGPRPGMAEIKAADRAAFDELKAEMAAADDAAWRAQLDADPGLARRYAEALARNRRTDAEPPFLVTPQPSL